MGSLSRRYHTPILEGSRKLELGERHSNHTKPQASKQTGPCISKPLPWVVEDTASS